MNKIFLIKILNSSFFNKKESNDTRKHLSGNLKQFKKLYWGNRSRQVFQLDTKKPKSSKTMVSNFLILKTITV